MLELCKSIRRSYRVAVVLPVFNGEAHIGEAVESILNQTFTDFEFVIIDDGSTDSTAAILKTFATSQFNLKVLSGPNVGYTRALLKGIAASTGRFIARMDADDVSLPQRLATQGAYLDANPDCVVVGGAMCVIDADGDPVSLRKYPRSHEAIEQSHFVRGECALAHPTVMFRRGVYEAVGGYRPEYEPAEDFDLWMRMAELGRLANLPDPLVRYRVHLQSTTAMRSRSMVEKTLRIVDEGCARRGIQPPKDTAAYEPKIEVGRNGLLEYSRNLAVLAWRSGFYRTARKHARRQFRMAPSKWRSWKYFVRCYLGSVAVPFVNLALLVRGAKR